jgi:hypothetical protein
MKHTALIFLLLFAACGKPATETEQTAVDTVKIEVPNETIVTVTEDTTVAEGSNNEADALWESEPEEEEGDAPRDDSFNMYNGEYTLQSSSEAEEGSLTLTYQYGFTFTISITKSVADFCSGTIEGELTIDEYKTGSFEYDGKPVHIRFTLSGIEVEDPERQPGVGTCEYSGTYVMEGD